MSCSYRRADGAASRAGRRPTAGCIRGSRREETHGQVCDHPQQEADMAGTGGDALIQRIKEWGVSRVFGYPGDGIGEFDGALGKAAREGHGLEYVRPTHEEICALMATAHAKFTGEVGVCVATSSPGAFHLLNGLYDAKSDNQAVVAIVGQQGLAALGTFTQQEDNLERVFADVACYVQTVLTPQQAQVVLDTAFRTAKARLQPAVVILPHDVQ